MALALSWFITTSSLTTSCITWWFITLCTMSCTTGDMSPEMALLIYVFSYLAEFAAKVFRIKGWA